MPIIHCESRIQQIGSVLLIKIPLTASKEFSSRGMLMIEGRINQESVLCPLEPDGKGSHWLMLSEEILHTAKLKIGDVVSLELKESSSWQDPELPQDFAEALSRESQIWEFWSKITPKAKWEWVRWIRATNNDKTRKKRIETAIDKLLKGDKRPCCFNSSMCTDYSVSSGGVLIEL